MVCTYIEFLGFRDSYSLGMYICTHILYYTFEPRMLSVGTTFLVFRLRVAVELLDDGKHGTQRDLLEEVSEAKELITQTRSMLNALSFCNYSTFVYLPIQGSR